MKIKQLASKHAETIEYKKPKFFMLALLHVEITSKTGETAIPTASIVVMKVRTKSLSLLLKFNAALYTQNTFMSTQILVE